MQGEFGYIHTELVRMDTAYWCIAQDFDELGLIEGWEKTEEYNFAKSVVSALATCMQITIYGKMQKIVKFVPCQNFG